MRIGPFSVVVPCFFFGKNCPCQWFVSIVRFANTLRSRRFLKKVIFDSLWNGVDRVADRFERFEAKLDAVSGRRDGRENFSGTSRSTLDFV